MKKLLLFTFLTLSSLSYSQIDAGTFMTGGSATFNHFSHKESGFSQTSLVISPQFGFAFADNFVAGAWLSFASFSNFSSWGVAPFVRYYAKNFFGQLGYGYTRSGDVGQSLLDVEIGYAMFLTDNVALEPAAYYNQYFNDGLNGNDLGLKIGFQIYFNR